MASTGFWLNDLKSRVEYLIAGYDRAFEWVLEDYENEWKSRVLDYKYTQSKANWFALRFSGRKLTDSQAALEFYAKGNDDWGGMLSNKTVKSENTPTKSVRHHAILTMMRLIEEAEVASNNNEEPVIYLDDGECWIFDAHKAYKGQPSKFEKMVWKND